MNSYDVVILGGGPAGTATALALQKHNPTLSVAILESSAYDRTRVGETLPPGICPLLEQLDVWPAFLHQNYLPAYGTCAAWGSADLHENEFIFSPYGRGWHLDRRDFDAMLADEAVRRGVSLFSTAKMTGHHRQGDGGWQLTVRSKDLGSFDLKAAFVVDATGRLAVFAREQGARKIIFDRLVGVFVFFDLDRALADTYTLVEAWEGGWWYSALLPNGEMVVACMSDADLVKAHCLKSLGQWFKFVDKTQYTRERLARARPRTAPRVYAAHSHYLDNIAGDGWLATGDATAAFDPLSSQGIFKALRSGICAAYAISDHLNGDVSALRKYKFLLKQEFQAYLKTWMDYYNQEQRWPESTFWRRRYRHRALTIPQHTR